MDGKLWYGLAHSNPNFLNFLCEILFFCRTYSRDNLGLILVHILVNNDPVQSLSADILYASLSDLTQVSFTTFSRLFTSGIVRFTEHFFTPTFYGSQYAFSPLGRFRWRRFLKQTTGNFIWEIGDTNRQSPVKTPDIKILK